MTNHPPPFGKTVERQAFDKLLTIYPHLDPLGVTVNERDFVIELGQRSEGNVEAWARWVFVIERASGRVYCIEHDGERVELNLDW